jgi:PPOX class probable F420-dependent enzyme
VLDGNDIIFTTGKTTVKARAMQRDPRVCVCVDDETPPFSFASITGTVTFSEVPGELVRWATAIGGRYMGADRAEAFGKRNAVPGELVVRLVPTHVIFQRDLAA